MASTDPLAPIAQAETDIEQAVATETTVLTALIAAVKALGSQPTVDPAEVKALADKFEAQVAALNTSSASGQAAEPPAPAPAPTPAP